MRVAYICADPGVPVFGKKGASVHVQEVVRAMVQRGVDVEIFATRLDGNPPADLRDVRAHWLSALPKGDLAEREAASLGANRGLHAMLRGCHSFDMVYERYSIWSYAGMEFARESGIPGLLEVNAPLIEEQAAHRGLVHRSAAEQVAQRVFNAASALIVVSREVAHYLESYPGVSARVHVISNGVNPHRFTPDLPPLLHDSRGRFTVGFIGTLKPWHGLPVLASAFAKFHGRNPDTRLVIGGDGPERSATEEELAAWGVLDASEFAGALDPEVVPRLLTSMDACVAPYPADGQFYFSPLKVYEYMASGRAVVASAIGQIVDIIEHGVNGLLCAPGDVAAFADALEELKNSPELCSALGRAARESVLREHTWALIVDRILGVARAQGQSVAGGQAA